jgi:hypothetical protein
MFFVGIFDKAFFAALHKRLCKEEKSICQAKLEHDLSTGIE